MLLLASSRVALHDWQFKKLFFLFCTGYHLPPSIHLSLKRSVLGPVPLRTPTLKSRFFWLANFQEVGVPSKPREDGAITSLAHISNVVYSHSLQYIYLYLWFTHPIFEMAMNEIQPYMFEPESDPENDEIDQQEQQPQRLHQDVSVW